MLLDQRAKRESGVCGQIEPLINKHRQRNGSLIAILQDVQDEYKYLPREALVTIARGLKIPLVDVYGVATFFNSFSLEPKGRHSVTVCLGTACHVRGGFKVAAELERQLDIKLGQTRKDYEFSLETVNCLGCCAIGPIVVIDGKYSGQMTISKVRSLIKQFSKNIARAKKARECEG